MDKTDTYIVIFNDQEDECTWVGFSLLEKADAKRYMKAVKALSAKDERFIIDNEEFIYDSENFFSIKLTEAEAEVIKKIFDIDENDAVGVFPDAESDAEQFSDMDNEEEY